MAPIRLSADKMTQSAELFIRRRTLIIPCPSFRVLFIKVGLSPGRTTYSVHYNLTRLKLKRP